jgi:hypothetical protein
MRNLRRGIIQFLGIAVALFAFAGIAGAYPIQGTVVFTGSTDSSGTGFGTLNNLLILQNNGTEAGTIAWNGTTDVGTGDLGSNHSQTYSFTQLENLGILSSGNLLISYNVNQTGAQPDTVLSSTGFQLIVYDPTGAIVAETQFVTSGIYTAGGGGGQQGQGSAAYLFNLDATALSLLAPYFGAGFGNYHLGATGTITSANDGPDGFYIVSQPVSPVPEPGTLLLVAGGLLGLAVYGRKRSRA